MPIKRPTMIFLVVLTAISLTFCFIIARPFIRPIISAVVIAIVFYPVHSKVSHRIRNQSVAATISTIFVVLVILVPIVLIGLAIANELNALYHMLSEESEQSGGWRPFILRLLDKPMAWAGRYFDLGKIDLVEEIRVRLGQASSVLLAQGSGIVRNIASFLVNSIITLFTLFFIFREGKSARRRLAAVAPLTADQVDRLFVGIQNAIMGTFYGGLAVAFAQGALTSITFVILGLPSPMTWGLVAAMFSLVPMIGSAAVWLPAAIILFAAGSWVKGVIMIAIGAGVIGTVDNIIRPYVISGHVQLHTLLVFFAVLGGIQAFGILGLFVGPVVLAVTMALFQLIREEWRAGKSKTVEGDSVCE